MSKDGWKKGRWSSQDSPWQKDLESPGMDWVTGKLTGNLRDPMVKMTAICRFFLRPILGMKMQFCLEDRFNDGVCASQNNVWKRSVRLTHTFEFRSLYVPNTFARHPYKWHRSFVSRCHGSQGLPFSARSTNGSQGLPFSARFTIGRGDRTGSATVSIHSTFLEREILTHAMPPVLMCSDQWPLKFGEVQIAFETETVNSLFCIRIEIVFSTCFGSQAAFISTGPKSPVRRCHHATVHLGEMLVACHWSHLNLIPLGGSQRGRSGVA